MLETEKIRVTSGEKKLKSQFSSKFSSLKKFLEKNRSIIKILKISTDSKNRNAENKSVKNNFSPFSKIFDSQQKIINCFALFHLIGKVVKFEYRQFFAIRLNVDEFAILDVEQIFDKGSPGAIVT